MVFIDPNVVEKAVRYIVRNQAPDGSFANTGIVSHKAMYGPSTESMRSLTAYTLIALQQVKNAEIIRVSTRFFFKLA